MTSCTVNMKGFLITSILCVLLQSWVFGDPIRSEKCKHYDADIVIILDSSSSIWGPHFDMQLQFSAKFAKLVGVGRSGSQVGVVAFGHYVKPIFNLNTYTTLPEVSGAILGIQHLVGRKTYTNLALKWVRQHSFTKSNGGRDGVPKVVVLLTDGKSSDGAETKKEAQLLKDDGVQVFAVGIGDKVSKPELKTIASEPADNFVLIFEKFEDLKDVSQLKKLAYKTCEVTTEVPTTVTTTTPAPTTTTTPPIPDEVKRVCKGKPADVAFILDKSSSIGGNEFAKLLHFVKDVVRALDVGYDKTRISVLTYASWEDVYVEFFLDTSYNPEEIIDRIDAIHYTGGGTDTATALEVATFEVFSTHFGSRTGVPKVGIVVTDGISEDETKTKDAARQAKSAGILLMAIGVGNQYDSIELENIASEKKYVHTANSYGSLNTLRDELAKQTCEAEIPQSDKRLCGSGDHDVDIMFSVDASSVGKAELGEEMRFIKSISETFDIENGRVQCGLTVDCPDQSDIILKASKSRLDFKDAVSSIEQSAIFPVMHKTREEGFSYKNGARHNSEKIMILFVNGRIDDPKEAMEEAFRLKMQEKIRIFVLAIGNYNSTLVDQIASHPPGDHVIAVKSHSELDDIRSKLEERLCALL